MLSTLLLLLLLCSSACTRSSGWVCDFDMLKKWSQQLRHLRFAAVLSLLVLLLFVQPSLICLSQRSSRVSSKVAASAPAPSPVLWQGATAVALLSFPNSSSSLV
jgi:Tfp pilus assembly protein PilP